MTHRPILCTNRADSARKSDSGRFAAQKLQFLDRHPELVRRVAKINDIHWIEGLDVTDSPHEEFGGGSADTIGDRRTGHGGWPLERLASVSGQAKTASLWIILVVYQTGRP